MARTLTARLARLATAAGATRAPFYMRRPIAPTLERIYPTEGWYWAPPAGDRIEFLGGSYEQAVRRLYQLLEDTDT